MNNSFETVLVAGNDQENISKRHELAKENCNRLDAWLVANNYSEFSIDTKVEEEVGASFLMTEVKIIDKTSGESDKFELSNGDNWEALTKMVRSSIRGLIEARQAAAAD